ncbi:MAG: Holliday junction resolvase RuvX [Actinomyces sp.]|nr:MAG: Holliday junction resolvase RuvX [Actinomyces sp.]
MRALGLDLGSVRIGVAVSDSAGTLATPVEVVQRSGDRARDHRRIADLVAEWEAEIVVVGLPLSLDGTIGPAARSALEETAELGDTLDVPVVSYDERLTTVTAERHLREQKMTSPERRRVVDKVAAAVMLQAWLDAGMPHGR